MQLCFYIQTIINNSYERILLILQLDSTPLRKSGTSLVSVVAADRLVLCVYVMCIFYYCRFTWFSLLTVNTKKTGPQPASILGIARL